MGANHGCIHEQQLQTQSEKLAELEAKNGFKDQRINELIEDNRRIESKIDNLTDTVNKVMLNSIKDDKDIEDFKETCNMYLYENFNILKQ